MADLPNYSVIVTPRKRFVKMRKLTFVVRKSCYHEKTYFVVRKICYHEKLSLLSG